MHHRVERAGGGAPTNTATAAPATIAAPATSAVEVREVREGGGQEGGVGFRGAVRQQHALTRAAATQHLLFG